MKIHRHYYIAIAILAVSVVLGELYFRYLVELGMGEKVPLSKPLSSVPLQLGDWHGVDEPIAPDVLMKIGAMDTLKRNYVVARAGRDVAVDLYIAYFGGIRGTAPHHPDICLPGAGFSVLSTDFVDVRLPGFGSESLRVRQDVFEHSSGQKRLVVWWEYIHGENVASRTLQRLKWVLPKFLGGKRGSVLQVQIGVNFTGETDDSLAAVTQFMDRLGPYVRAVLPDAAGSDAPGSQVGKSTARRPDAPRASPQDGQ